MAQGSVCGQSPATSAREDKCLQGSSEPRLCRAFSAPSLLVATGSSEAEMRKMHSVSHALTPHNCPVREVLLFPPIFRQRMKAHRVT